MQEFITAAMPAADPATGAEDVGPLAWVLGELRKSVEASSKALRRFARESTQALPPDAGTLVQVHHQLHQAAGVLEMVRQAAPARALGAAEAVVRSFIERPSDCTEAAAQRIERLGSAVIDFLQALLSGRKVNPVALFAQYRDLLERCGKPAHPADLWMTGWHWAEVTLADNGPVLACAPALRTRIERELLGFIQSGDPGAAHRLHEICIGLARGATLTQAASFWALASAFFESLALSLLPVDLYVKRTASRVLLEYAALAQGAPTAADALGRELLFFCAQAAPAPRDAAPMLSMVHLAWGAIAMQPVDYAQERFGLFDPALLAQARKRIEAARQAWAELSGDGSGLGAPQATSAFAQLAESLQRLYPPCLPVAQALASAAEAAGRTGQPPGAELAMEAATAVLYLEAVFEDLDPTDPLLPKRMEQLAGRIARARESGHGEPLAPWMEELYRRMSERHTMGSVVDELRGHLGEIEKAMDTFFRQPTQTQWLHDVPGQLGQMRGVFSVLGLEPAAQAVQHMREQATQWMADAAPGGFDSMGNNLGALGLLIDMLGYQPALAKRVFVFEAQAGELRPLMGRQADTLAAAPKASEASEAPYASPPGAHEAPQAGPLDGLDAFPVPHTRGHAESETPAAEPTRPAPIEALPGTLVLELQDDDLRGIFLEEAREVVRTGLDATAALAHDNDAADALAVLRRAFHTLKGSARMVGLTEFAEAAWAMEQALNAWLDDPRPTTPALCAGADQALRDFAGWTEAIATHAPQPWQADAFRQLARTLCLDTPTPAPEPTTVPGSNEVPAAGLQEALSFAPEEEAARFPLPQEGADERVAPLAIEPWQPPRVEEIPDLDYACSQDGEDDPAPVPQASAFAQPEQAAAPAVRTIGPLRIGQALFDVYLNEADAWSNQLIADMAAWARQPDAPIADASIALAHSLAGSSATVGFTGLANAAQLIEQALLRLQTQPLQGPDCARQGTALAEATEELRHLLHQFAAGFLREPAPHVLQALRALAAGTPSHDANGTPPQTPAVAPVTSVTPVTPAAPVDMRSEVALDDALEPGGMQGDAPDAVDGALFPVFEEEAVELLADLNAALHGWQAQPSDPAPRAAVLRTLHTFKGSARLLGAMRLGECAHRMESVVEATPADAADHEAIAPLLQGLDGLQAGFDALRQADAAAQSAIAQRAAMPEEAPAMARTSPAPQAPATLGKTHEHHGHHGPAAPALPSPGTAERTRTQTGAAVRIRTRLLDRLLTQAGEVILSRSRLTTALGPLRGGLAELTGNLDRLRQQLRDVEMQAEGQMQSRIAQTRDAQQAFDPLEFDRFTRVQELTRMMAESVNDVATVQRTLHKAVQACEEELSTQARQTRELQRGLLRTRMVEFEGIADRLYRVVRQAAKDSGKPVRLDIEGGRIEMDRSVLERMTPVFEHLLRNAVAHGIEAAPARMAAGKTAAGQLRIALHQEGNDVSIRFSDDGAGLDLARIAERACALGLIAPGETPSPERCAELIFAPGFSTAAQLSPLAGRGIGMDVVRTETAALGGRVETHSDPGQGMHFTLVLPLTTAVTHVVLVRAGGLTIGLPSNRVELVQRLDTQALEQCHARQHHAYGGVQIPFFHAGALLQAPAHGSNPAGKAHPVLIARSAAQRIALHVDEVLGQQEVVVKNLGPQLARLPGLAGLSVLASGTVVLIYNPVALAAVHGEAARQCPPALPGSTGAQAPSPIPLVLVVDDSITVRRVTQRLLQREGYRVALAADGLQALELLRQERPALVLSDIEMPRMDGFDLVRNIRADMRLARLPVVMISSRIAAKHRAHAQQLGIDHYLGKPYSEEELLRLVSCHTHSDA